MRPGARRHRLEPVGLGDDPRRQVPAVAPPVADEAVGVGPPHGDGVVHPGHDVVVVGDAPRVDVGVHERLAVVGAAAEVRLEDDVAVAREELGGSVERLERRPGGAAVGVDDERPGAALLVADRLRQHPLDRLAVAVRPADGLDRAELDVLVTEPRVRVGEPDRFPIGRCRVDLGGPIRARADPHPPRPVFRERPGAVAPARGRGGDHRARLDADPEQAGGRALAGGPVDEPSVRRPDGGGELPVDVLEEARASAPRRRRRGRACCAACCSTRSRSRRTRWSGRRATSAARCRCRRSRGGAAARPLATSTTQTSLRQPSLAVGLGRVSKATCFESGDQSGFRTVKSPSVRRRVSDVSRSCSQRWVIRCRASTTSASPSSSRRFSSSSGSGSREVNSRAEPSGANSNDPTGSSCSVTCQASPPSAYRK